MLNFGNINAGGSGGSKWIYNGGSAPDKIQTIPGVTGIKNPLQSNIDFKQWFAANELGFDFVAGSSFNDGMTLAAQFVVQSFGAWFAVNTANDATLNQEATNIVLPDRILDVVKNFNNGDEMQIDHVANYWLLKDQSFTNLFRITNTGAIGTNQIIPAVAAPHHNFDLPIHDANNNLVGYIRIYQP
jgi:hypothetical protein